MYALYVCLTIAAVNTDELAGVALELTLHTGNPPVSKLYSGVYYSLHSSVYYSTSHTYIAGGRRERAREGGREGGREKTWRMITEELFCALTKYHIMCANSIPLQYSIHRVPGG